METKSFYEPEKSCAEERLSASVGVDYAASLYEMNWFRFNGCKPSGKLATGDSLQGEENVQVYLNKEWPLSFFILLVIVALRTDTTRSPALSRLTRRAG